MCLAPPFPSRSNSFISPATFALVFSTAHLSAAQFRSALADNVRIPWDIEIIPDCAFSISSNRLLQDQVQARFPIEIPFVQITIGITAVICCSSTARLQSIIPDVLTLINSSSLYATSWWLILRLCANEICQRLICIIVL